ncbi:MAG TPA: hypothetical protein P5291_00440, partial [Flavobacteriales bacterium]|nr:hypothetical protein [Flavobacteriales bacterium]
ERRARRSTALIREHGPQGKGKACSGPWKRSAVQLRIQLRAGRIFHAIAAAELRNAVIALERITSNISRIRSWESI